MSSGWWPPCLPEHLGITSPADYEPTDLDLASNGINTYPTDPGDAPSYDTLTSPKGPTT